MGDLNFPGRVPAAIIGYRPLATSDIPPAHPLVQLDHLLLKGELGQVGTPPRSVLQCRTTRRCWRT